MDPGCDPEYSYEITEVNLRDLPSVDELINSQGGRDLIGRFGRDLALSAIRSALDSARNRILDGGPGAGSEQLLQHALENLGALLAPTLRPVINATGVILHTNLGRAPLCLSAQTAIMQAASEYGSLELELSSGERGSRNDHVEALLTQACGAEAGLVVNNNAGAVLLALTAIAAGKQAIISRTQLVEIGGGFRIPDVMDQSGAQLVEVGTTNRTHLSDFESAISGETGVILRAHHSNFRLIGFTTEPPLRDLAKLSREHDIPLLDDLGSGALLETSRFGLGHEPTVQESLQSGASLVAFSGDKLLGGPQAGLLVGDLELIQSLKRHPLARALRADKLCLAGLAATLGHYLRGDVTETVPVWQMIAADPDDLKARAQGWQSALGHGEVSQGESTVGGGSLPGGILPTWQLAVDSQHPDRSAALLREAPTPVVCRIQSGRLLFDPRTVLAGQDDLLLSILRSTLASGQPVR